MDTKKLTILLEAIKVGSLKKAAEKLNYTQSGLIYLMNSLENELGIHLLNRTTKGIQLTQEGEILEPLIRRIVDSEEELMEKISDIQKGGTRKLRIGAYPIYACYCLPGVMKEFLHDYPENEISIRVATSKELPKLLKDDEVDVAIGEMGLVDGVEWTYLMNYEIYAAMPAKLLEETPESVSFDMLKDYPLLFSTYNQISNQIEKLLNHKNQYKINVHSDDGSALLKMVEEGLGIAFMSSLYLNECPETVTMVPLEPPIVRELGVLVKHKNMDSPLIKNFLSYLQDMEGFSPENVEEGGGHK